MEDVEDEHGVMRKDLKMQTPTHPHAHTRTHGRSVRFSSLSRIKTELLVTFQQEHFRVNYLTLF